MLKPLEPKFRCDLSVRLRYIAEKLFPGKLKLIVVFYVCALTRQTGPHSAGSRHVTTVRPASQQSTHQAPREAVPAFPRVAPLPNGSRRPSER